MGCLIYGVLMLIGFVIGYFFASWLLTAITIVWVVATLWLWATMREIGVLYTMLVGICGGVLIAVMWLTHYFATGQSWMGGLFRDVGQGMLK